MRQVMQGDPMVETQQEDKGGGHATMPRAVAMAMMTVRRNNRCGRNNNATTMTCINPLCTMQ